MSASPPPRPVPDRIVGAVYEQPDRPPSQRWQAVCVDGDVLTGHSREEAGAKLLHHTCDPHRTSWQRRAFTGPEWVSAVIASLDDGTTPPPLDPAEFSDRLARDLARGVPVTAGPVPPPRDGVLWRSELQHWTACHSVTGGFQSGGLSVQAEADDDHSLGRLLDLVFAHPDRVIGCALRLTPNVRPVPDHMSLLRLDFDTDAGVGAALLTAYGRDGTHHHWITRGPAGRPDTVLVHDHWNAAETRFPPGSFVTIPELRHLVHQWAFGEGVLPPPCVVWRDAAEVFDHL